MHCKYLLAVFCLRSFMTILSSLFPQVKSSRLSTAGEQEHIIEINIIALKLSGRANSQQLLEEGNEILDPMEWARQPYYCANKQAT